MPNSHRISKTPLVASGVFLFLLGSIALVSRCRLSAVINSAFTLGVGTEYQSWFEHFFSGFASPSFLFFSLFPLWSVLTHKREGNPNTRFFRRAREWLLSQSEHRLYILLLSISATLYVAISANWEFGQFQERGIFQWGQFGCDVVGSLIWFLLLKQLCPNDAQPHSLRSLDAAQ